MIRLSNGHAFEYMAASGALGFNGKGWPWEQPWRWLGFLDPSLFTSVTKTLTLDSTIGNLRWFNPFWCIRFIRNGVVNAVGLSNPGIDWWCKNIGSLINPRKIRLIVSISGSPEELRIMAKILNSFEIFGIEINRSCPNISTCGWQGASDVLAACEAVRSQSRLPLILKLSVDQDVFEIVKEVGNMIEAFSINSVPWFTVFPNRPSPLSRFGGGSVSGQAAQTHTWRLVKILTEITDIPVIGPSIWKFDDLKKVRDAGAKAVSFGSIFLRYPWRPTLFIRKERRLLMQTEI